MGMFPFAVQPRVRLLILFLMNVPFQISGTAKHINPCVSRSIKNDSHFCVEIAILFSEEICGFSISKREGIRNTNEKVYKKDYNKPVLCWNIRTK